MPYYNGYYYPVLQSYNSTTGQSSAPAANPVFSGTVYVSGALSASNYNAEGVKEAEGLYPAVTGPRAFQWYDDFVAFYLDAQYYPSVNGTYLSTTSQTQAMFNSGAAPDAYGIGAWLGRVSAVSGVAGITYGYNNSLGRFKQIRARGGFWLDSLSVANSESFSASIGIGLHGGSLLVSTRNTAYLAYCDHVSPNWRVVGRNNAFSIDTGMPVVANNFYIFDFCMRPLSQNLNTANNSGSWIVKNVTANTVTSGTFVSFASQYYGLAHETGLLFASITKNFGTSNRNMYVDWWEFIGTF